MLMPIDELRQTIIVKEKDERKQHTEKLF